MYIHCVCINVFATLYNYVCFEVTLFNYTQVHTGKIDPKGITEKGIPNLIT